MRLGDAALSGIGAAHGAVRKTKAARRDARWENTKNRKQKEEMGMNITYTDEKKFTKEQTQKLFLSVGWVSGEYPERLHKALMGSSTVFSAWDGDRLIGLVRVLDDTEMTAYMHYVLVDPEYQGHGIAGHLVGMVKEKYRDYLYIEVMPEESKNATFYQMHGFHIMEDGVAMQICNPGEKR